LRQRSEALGFRRYRASPPAYVLAILIALLSSPAAAHKPSDSYLTLRGEPDGIAVRWDIALRDLDYVLQLDRDGNGELTWGEVRQRSTRKNWTEVDFGKLVQEAVEATRTGHHLKDGELHLENRPDDELLVRGNAEELRTLVHNLFDNALKYSGDRKDIAVEIKTPTLDTVSLSVRDKGTGIPKGELKRIFKRFYRAQSEKTKQVKGTGLGLFIVRSVARRYGGDAYAESAGEGQGSTFFVRLPRVYRA
jgi:signal transduction histidine kinase